MRTLLPFGLFLAAALGLLSADAVGQNKGKQTEPKNKYAPPAPTKPNEDTLKQIAEKTKALRTAVEALKAKNIPDDVLVEVEIHLKSAEYIVEFNEWYHKDSGKWTLLALDRGLERAKQAEEGKAPWREQIGRWVPRAYRSKVDGSVQPYAVLLPHDYGKDPKKKWRLDIVLHGRDSSLTEAKFIATHDSTKEAPKDLGYVQLEPYGRGNNAYRWAGEQDVMESVQDFLFHESLRLQRAPIDHKRIVLRGFSMGGAGTWHLGLHHPFSFAVIGPGAGFTETHGYIKGLPNPLPDYREKCLRIYDAVRYAENAFNVPVVAYSGANDPQKAAADNIEKALKGFSEKLRFTHLIAPGLEHKMPPEWQAKAEAEYRKYIEAGKSFPERVRFVTYTLRFNDYGWGHIEALEEHYKKAVIEGIWSKDRLTFKTENIRALSLRSLGSYGPDGPKGPLPTSVSINGQELSLAKVIALRNAIHLFNEGGKWKVDSDGWQTKEDRKSYKGPKLQGPIDDAFMEQFCVVPSSGKGWHPAIDVGTTAAFKQFEREWKKFFRGNLPIADSKKVRGAAGNIVLFGDPESNPLISQIVSKLPIAWTREKLVVDGVEYDPKSHYPVLIQPLPPDMQREYRMGGRKLYVVINSGHTFHEAELKGTNAQLYPRLGDWAVLKIAPTPTDPAATEVVAAGLFDENWQFPKKP